MMNLHEGLVGVSLRGFWAPRIFGLAATTLLLASLLTSPAQAEKGTTTEETLPSEVARETQVRFGGNSLDTVLTVGEGAEAWMFSIPTYPGSPEEIEKYESLSVPADVLLTRKMNFLRATAWVLHKTRKTKGYVKFAWQHTRRALTRAGRMVVQAFAHLDPDTENGSWNDPIPPPQEFRLTQEQAEQILLKLNRALFITDIVSRTSEEVSFTLGVAGQAEMGAARKGTGGLVQAQIYLGYNKKDKTLFIAFDLGRESFQNGITASFGLGLKAGVNLATTSAKSGTARIPSVIVYPPGTPMGSAYIETGASDDGTNRRAQTGVFALIGGDFSGGALPLVNQSEAYHVFRANIPSAWLHGMIAFTRSAMKAADGKLKSACASLLTGPLMEMMELGSKR